MQELQTVLGHYDHEIDEPDTIPFIAKIREETLVSDREWREMLSWLDDAMTYLEKGATKDDSGVLDVDADPRNTDWIRIVRAQRLARYRMPNWASLWLWWIGHDHEEDAYWKPIGRIAKAMGFPRFAERRR